ncbi:MAG: hypothetical protein SNJ56_01660 [Termitinemataceae bacterium]
MNKIGHNNSIVPMNKKVIKGTLQREFDRDKKYLTNKKSGARLWEIEIDCAKDFESLEKLFLGG